MTRPGSLHQRNRAVRNLRAAPSWLTPHRVERILAVLGSAPAAPVAPAPVVIDEGALHRVVEAAIAAAMPRAAALAPQTSRSPALRTPRSAPSIVAEPDPAQVVTANASEPAASSRRTRIAEIASALSTRRRAPAPSALAPVSPVAPARPIAPVAAAEPRTAPTEAPKPAKSYLNPDVEKLSGAVAFLRNRSISIRAASASPINSTWTVSGYIDPLTPVQVMALARKHGFEADVAR